QPRVTRTADWELSAVRQHGDTGVFRAKLDLRQPREVQDVAAVDAHEGRRVEQRLEFAERLFLEIRLAAGPNGHVIVLRFDPVDLLDGDDVDVGAIANEDAL